MGQPKEHKPFDLALPTSGPVSQAVANAIESPIEKILGLTTLNRIYDRVMLDKSTDTFWAKALRGIGVKTRTQPGDIEKIPTTGPLLVIANHPYGGIDGMILAALLLSIRPDVKVMGNFLLNRIPDVQQDIIPVDPFNRKDSVLKNLRGIRQSIDWIKAGHCLVVFPAGEVSHLDLSQRAVVDASWNTTLARIVRRTETAVQPVFFHGTNSMIFQIAGMIHPMLRTAMLPREMLRKQTQTIDLSIGTPIPFKRLDEIKDDRGLVDYLRLRTYVLCGRHHAGAKQVKHAAKRMPTLEPVIPPVDQSLLVAEIKALPPESLITQGHDITVYAAAADQIPNVLREIGRLREVTFRGVFEGTGKSIDLDEFDQTYIHLIAWQNTKQEIIGAYRMGRADEIIARQGVTGLYTNATFAYEAALLEQCGPAIELGRSFIRKEYQKSFPPLMLLWRGIGQYMVRHPKYKILFGPVSINNEYCSISRQLIMSFLTGMVPASDLWHLIRPKNPPRVRPMDSTSLKAYSMVVRDMDEVSELVAEIEADQKGVPILLKQYMKLGARILGFNIDPDFGDVLDGLMLVDLRRTDRRIVEKFVGKAETEILLGKAVAKK